MSLSSLRSGYELFLSTIQARRWKGDVCQAFLAYVVAKPEVEADLREISMVREFSDVFREDLRDCPHNKI
jgi:hypothetical protein